MSATARPPQVAGAEAQLARDYERLKPELLRTVRSRLAAGGVHVDEADLEGFYNQAWHALYVKLVGGEPIESRNGLLVSIMYRRALDELRSRRPVVQRDLEQEPVEHDLPGQLDDRVRVGHLIEGFRERLAGRELQAAVLCYVHDFSRSEAAEQLGIRPRRMKKLMDEVSKTIGELVGDLNGGDWCDSRQSLIKAYALGLLDRDGQRYELASDHLRSCSACRHRVLAIRGLAGLAPPLPVLVGAMAAGTADAPRGRPRRPDAARRVATKATALGATGALVAAIATVAATRGGDEPPPRGAAARLAPAGEAAAARPQGESANRARARRERERRRERARRARREREAERTKRTRERRRHERTTPAGGREERRRERGRPAERRTGATPATSELAAPPPADATPAPVATPPPAATPAPTAPPAVTPEARQPPARDGWEEFELH